MCAAADYHQTKGLVCVGAGGTHYIGVGKDNQMGLYFQSLSGTGVCFITKLYGKDLSGNGSQFHAYIFIFAHRQANFAHHFHDFCRLHFFSKSAFFDKIFPPECQTVCIQIRPDMLSGLIWVQTVCKSYH